MTILSPRKGKVCPVTCYEGTEGQLRYRSARSAALDKGGWSTRDPSRSTSGETPLDPLEETGWASAPIWDSYGEQKIPCPTSGIKPRTLLPSTTLNSTSKPAPFGKEIRCCQWSPWAAAPIWDGYGEQKIPCPPQESNPGRCCLAPHLILQVNQHLSEKRYVAVSGHLVTLSEIEHLKTMQTYNGSFALVPWKYNDWIKHEGLEIKANKTATFQAEGKLLENQPAPGTRKHVFRNAGVRTVWHISSKSLLSFLGHPSTELLRVGRVIYPNC
jgi:hypothetical protein